MKLKTLQLLTAIGLLSLTALPLQAQVTIGSGIEPAEGALLDLKEQKKDDGSENSTKGLLLPRVKLSDLNKLYPMFTGTYDAVEDAKHAGLTVYNLTQCDGKFARGVYTWTGTEWLQLTNNPILSTITALTFTPALPPGNPAFVEIPSGQDLRTAWTSAFAPAINFNNISSVTGAWANTIGGGFTFTSNPLSPAFPATWTISPVSGAGGISVWPDAMTASDLTSNPFLTRESKLTITGGAACPGGTGQTQEIILNQTNYAIAGSESGDSIPLLVLRDTDQKELLLYSNVRWQATASDGTAAWSDILGSYTTEQTGSERHDGSGNTNTFNYTSTNPVVLNNRYKIAQVTFSDVENKAKPVSVNIMQCQGTPDMSSVTKVATPDQTSAGDASWDTGTTKADKVVRHQAKPNPAYVDAVTTPNEPVNIYEEFYSADFGSAGRWMTTNLAAWKYDGINHRTDPDGTATSGSGVPRTLIGPNMAGNMALVVANWCYPGNLSGTTDLGGVNDMAYQNNPDIGLLYSWDAATAGKAWGNVNESNMDETTTNESGKQQRIQGICPAGWHLPSAMEWTSLENEIIRNTTSYADVSQNISPDSTTGLLTGGNIFNRGTTQGQAMKEICGLNDNDPNGKSNIHAMGGFNVLLVNAAAADTTIDNLGLFSCFWSSSSLTNGLAWPLYLSYAETCTFSPTSFGCYGMYSIRCKKDD